MNKEKNEIYEQIKLSEIRLNERENEIFKLETLKKTKSVEKSHIELEFNNLNERIDKYRAENKILNEEIQKKMEKSEYFHEIILLSLCDFIKIKIII